jgi:ubiquinone/menaquinone biosynthesis C-methylase UbiE
MDIMESKFRGISGGKILDVGTGSGSFIPTFTDLFKDYTEIIGIDSSERAINAAKQAFKQDNIRFMQMDAAHMDFEDNSMDTVCISNTLHHLSNMNEVLKEMLRVLKPGGLFIINEMFCDNQSEKQLSHVYVHHLFGEIDTLLGNYHAKTFKKQEIINIANKIGINVEDTFEYSTHAEQEEHPNAEEEKETLDDVFSSMDMYVEKIKGKPEYEDIKNRIKELKGKLYSVGIYGATELVVLGRK